MKLILYANVLAIHLTLEILRDIHWGIKIILHLWISDKFWIPKFTSSQDSVETSILLHKLP